MVIGFEYLRNLKPELAMRAVQLLWSALQDPYRPLVLLQVGVKDKLTSAGQVVSSPPSTHTSCAPVTAPVTNTGIALEAHSLQKVGKTCLGFGRQVWQTA